MHVFPFAKIVYIFKNLFVSYMDSEIIKLALDVSSPLIKTALEFFIANRQDVSKENQKFATDHYAEYLNISAKNFSTIKVLGLKGASRKLSEIYIPATLYCPFSAGEEEYFISTFPKELFEENSRVMVTDTAGMGKSTLLKVLFLMSLKEVKAMPILVDLRRLNSSHLLIDELNNLLLPMHLFIDEKSMLQVFVDGGFLFLFDGYDEIAPNDRAVVTRSLKKFMDNANQNTFVLTSRPEQELNSLSGFKELRIKPLTKKEAFELIERYDRYSQTSKALIKRLETNLQENIEEFLTNPLLVSLLFTSFNYKQTIPFKKHLFYRQVYDAIFESHDLTKGETYQHPKFSKLDIDDFERVLRFVGMYTMLKIQKVEYTKDELLSIIKIVKVKCHDLDFQESEFIRDLLSTVPLFLEDGGYLRWAHKSLQEYFCAQSIYVDTNNKELFLKNLFQSYNERFENLIDLYSDIDPIAFENTFVLSVLEDFERHVSSTIISSEIPKQLSNIRTSLIFNGYYVLFRRSEFHDSEDKMIYFTETEKLFKEKFNKNLLNYKGDSIYSERGENIIIVSHERYSYSIMKIISRNYPEIFCFIKYKDYVPKIEMFALEDSISKYQDLLSDNVNSLMEKEGLKILDLNSMDTVLCNNANFEFGNRLLMFLPLNTNFLDRDKSLALLNNIRRNKDESETLDFFSI